MFPIFLKKTGFRKVTDRFIKQGNQVKPKKILTDNKTSVTSYPYIEKYRKSKVDISDGTYIH